MGSSPPVENPERASKIENPQHRRPVIVIFWFLRHHFALSRRTITGCHTLVDSHIGLSKVRVFELHFYATRMSLPQKGQFVNSSRHRIR